MEDLPRKNSSIIEIENRTIKEAELYIMDPDITMKDVGNYFKISESCVHRDFHTRLKNLNLELYKKVIEKIKSVNRIKHLKGGEAARLYFAVLRKLLAENKK